MWVVVALAPYGFHAIFLNSIASCDYSQAGEVLPNKVQRAGGTINCTVSKFGISLLHDVFPFHAGSSIIRSPSGRKFFSFLARAALYALPFSDAGIYGVFSAAVEREMPKPNSTKTGTRTAGTFWVKLGIASHVTDVCPLLAGC